MRGFRVVGIILCTLWVFGVVGLGNGVCGELVVELPYGFGEAIPGTQCIRLGKSGEAETIVFKGYILSFVKGGYDKNMYLRIQKGSDDWWEFVDSLTQFFFIENGELWVKKYGRIDEVFIFEMTKDGVRERK